MAHGCPFYPLSSTLADILRGLGTTFALSLLTEEAAIPRVASNVVHHRWTETMEREKTESNVLPGKIRRSLYVLSCTTSNIGEAI